MSEVTPAEIIDFWLDDAVHSPEEALARHPTWYRCGPEFDAQIRSRFGAVVEQTLRGGLAEWESHPEGALALVITLDQFTRNLFRGTPEVYAGDARAWQVADACVATEAYQTLPVMGQVFLFHPFHHSERVAEQHRGVELVSALRDRVPAQWQTYLTRSVDGFSRHRDLVVRFGRFPHRNHVLGRADTPEEAEFLAAGADHFGQAPGPVATPQQG